MQPSSRTIREKEELWDFIFVNGRFLDEKDDFPDDCLKDKGAFQIVKLEVDAIIDEGRSALGCLASGFSRRLAFAMLNLAYNLRDVAGTEVFETIPPEFCTYSAGELATQVCRTSVEISHIKNAEDRKNLATFFCYIAASALRLFTKTPQNYIKAWSCILRSYRKFYYRGVPVALETPSEIGVHSLASFYTTSTFFRNTLYHMLRCRNLAVSEGFRTFLFEMHLEFTGLHFVSIFFQLREALGCPAQYILKAMEDPMAKRAIKLMTSVLNMESSEDQNYKKSMWRFGRIFDETYLVRLRTSWCLLPCYALASALHQERPSTASIMKIVHFRELSEEKKLKLDLAGAEIIRRIKARMEDECKVKNPDKLEPQDGEGC